MNTANHILRAYLPRLLGTLILLLGTISSTLPTAGYSTRSANRKTTTVAPPSTCGCPEPTVSQITALCNAVYDNTKPSKYELEEFEKSGMGYRFEKIIWEMSCAVPGVDTPEQAAVKIRAMWLKHRLKLHCLNMPGVLTSSNVLPFSVHANHFALFDIAVQEYKLDFDFIDPATGMTLMDFVVAQYKKYKSAGVELKAKEYLDLCEQLKGIGAKHASQLKAAEVKKH